MATDVVQLVIIGVVGGEFCENVLHFSDTVTADTNPVALANDLIEAWQTYLEPDWLLCLPNDYEVHGYKAKRINNTGGPTVMNPIAATPGGRGSASLVSSLSPLIVSSYVEGTKHRAGRIFLPGIADGDVIDNELSAGLLTAINTLKTDLANVIPGTLHNWVYGIWSRVHSAFHVPAGFNTSLLIGTQRRRLHPVL